MKVVSHPYPGITIIDRYPGHRRPPLKQGDKYTLPAGCGDQGTTYEVLSTTEAAAYVRPSGKVHRTVVAIDKKTGEEKVVQFDVPQRGFQVSRYSSVVLVEGEVS